MIDRSTPAVGEPGCIPAAASPDAGSSAVMALFDFDHTLTDCDTAARFFRWLLLSSRWRLAVVVLALPVLGPLLAPRRTRRLPIRFAVWLATLGRSHGDLERLIARHVAEVGAAGGVFVRRDARECIARHLAQGHRVVVATGALEALAAHILAAEAIEGVSVVGSTLRRRFGGMVSEQHCFGERKIPMLAARGFAAPWDFVYSDHSADLPILSRGRACFLVNPRPACALRIAAVLGDAPTVLCWR